MGLHALFGLHKPDLMASRWDEGRFVTTCLSCRWPMIKLPGEDWTLDRRKPGRGRSD